MLKIIKNFYDPREPLEWIKDFGTPLPQIDDGAFVVEITTEEPTIKETLTAENNLPWHHDKAYQSNVHEHVALYCVEAYNAGAIQFCDMVAAYRDAPEELKVQEKCVHSVRKFYKNNPDQGVPGGQRAQELRDNRFWKDIRTNFLLPDVRLWML